MATARRKGYIRPTPTKRRTTKRITPQVKKTDPAKMRKLKVEKKDIVIQPVQYAVVDNYVIAAESEAPKNFKKPEGRYGSEGSNRREDISQAHVYRIGENLSFFQFPCGDFLYFNIDHMIELFQSVKALDITPEPRKRER